MEFTQEVDNNLFKMIGNSESSLKIRDVAEKCHLVKTEQGRAHQVPYES